MTLAEGSGSGWSCFLVAQACTNSTVGVAANANFPL